MIEFKYTVESEGSRIYFCVDQHANVSEFMEMFITFAKCIYAEENVRDWLLTGQKK